MNLTKILQSCLIGFSLLAGGLLFGGCYAFHDKGINAYQAGANPEQGKLNELNHQGKLSHPDPDSQEGIVE